MLALVMVASPAVAQRDGDLELDFGIKTVVFFYNEVEGIRLSVERGWSLGGEIILWFPQGFGVGAEIEYYTEGEDIDVLPGVEITADYSMMPINLNAYYRFNNSGRGMVPYLGAGLSFVHARASTTTTIVGFDVDFSISDNFTGFNIFGGMEFGYFYIEAQWLFLDVDLGIADMIPTEHSEAGGLSFWVGLRF